MEKLTAKISFLTQGGGLCKSQQQLPDKTVATIGVNCMALHGAFSFWQDPADIQSAALVSLLTSGSELPGSSVKPSGGCRSFRWEQFGSVCTLSSSACRAQQRLLVLLSRAMAQRRFDRSFQIPAVRCISDSYWIFIHRHLELELLFPFPLILTSNYFSI